MGEALSFVDGWTDLFAHEYGWTIDYLDGRTVAELIVLKKQIRKRHAREYQERLEASAYPHMEKKGQDAINFHLSEILSEDVRLLSAAEKYPHLKDKLKHGDHSNTG